MIPMIGKTFFDEKSLLEDYLSQANISLSSFSFINLFIWQEFFKFDFNFIDGNLCVFAKNSLGTFMYLPPLGKNISLQTIHQGFEYMQSLNGPYHVSRIENVQENQRSLFPSDDFSFYKKGYEYCYYRKDLVNLKGNAYKSKRSCLNYFKKNYHFQYLSYQKEMKDDCLLLYENWKRQRVQTFSDDTYRQMIEENQSVHSLAMRYHKELGLLGRVVAVDGKIRAYSFGYFLNPSIFCVLFEIADLCIKGLSTFIFRELCDDPELKKFPFINCMDDFALKNIEQTKLSFRPVILIPSYVVTLKSDG